MPFRSRLKRLMPTGNAASPHTPHDYDFDRLPSYQYKSLPDDGQDWIRTLILRPSVSREAPLVCMVIPVLKGSRLYEALSYTWGDQSDRLPLAVMKDTERIDWSASCLASASAMHITRNLHTALLHLRKRKKHRYLWIDAVCINQADQNEKLKQIRLMGSIYSNAFRTIIWVGEANEDTGKLIFFLNLIRRISLELVVGEPLGKVTGKTHYGKLWDMDVALHRKLHALGITCRMWLSWQELCDRPWFQRVWTAQEVCLSQRALLLCGNHSIPWDRVASLDVPFLVETMFSANEMVATSERLNFCMHFRTARGGDETTKEFYTLGFIGSLSNAQATDPKDKVFGTLACAEELGVCFPPMAYTMSTAEIYATATRCWLQYGHFLGCLLFAVSPSTTPNIPSWSIDWNHIPETKRIQLLAFIQDMTNDSLATQDSDYQAIDELMDPTALHWRKLHLKGILLSDYVHKHVQSAGPQLAREYGFPAPPFRREEEYAQISRWKNRAYSVPWLQLLAEMQERPDSSSSNTDHDFTRLLDFLSRTSSLEAKDTVVLHALLEQVAVVSRSFAQNDQRDQRLELLSLSDAYRRENIGADRLFDALDLVAILSPYTLFSTTSGWLGGCYCEKMETGDVIALLAGSCFPMVLRPSATQGEYQLVGPAYIHKFMDGSVWSENVDNLEIITLV